jgi:hypothetical protein
MLRQPSTPDVRPYRYASLRSVLVEFERQLQRIPQGVIESKKIDSFPTLGRQMEMSFTVCSGGSQHCDAILGTIGYGHIWDGSTRRVKDNAFDSLRKLRLFDDYEFSNCLGGTDEERARKRD